MRPAVLSVFLTMAVLLPKTAPAQVMQIRTPAPEVTAAAAGWQIIGEPVVVQGLRYNATREMRMFDGEVMTQIDVFERVPIYADITREPFTIVYVPVSRDRMRSYERAPESPFAIASGRGTAPVPVIVAPAVPPPEEPRSVGTTGTIVPSPARRTTAESIRPRVPNGVWVAFNGARWYSSGAAAVYSAERFTPVGEYRGFPVYRDRTANRDEIWIAAVDGGLLAPYRKR